MNDEIPGWVGWLVGILAIALFAAFLWLGSWERVFLLIGAIFVAFLAGAVVAFTSAFTFTKAREVYTAAKWIEKLDERIAELEKHVDRNADSVGDLRFAIRDVESVLEEVRDVMKKDSKTMAESSVEDALDSVIDSL